MTLMKKLGISDYIFEIKKLLSYFRSDNERVLSFKRNKLKYYGWDFLKNNKKRGKGKALTLSAI